MNQNKLILFTICWVATFIAFYFFIWSPNIAKMRTAQSEINKKSAELAQLKTDVESWPKTATREKLEKYEDRLKYLFSLVPSKEEVPGLLDRIQEHGLSSDDLQFLSLTKNTKNTDNNISTKKNDYFQDSYVLTVIGKYFSIVRFLYELEQAERLINVESMSFRGQNNTNDHSPRSASSRSSSARGSSSARDGDVEAIITLSIFYTGT